MRTNWGLVVLGCIAVAGWLVFTLGTAAPSSAPPRYAILQLPPGVTPQPADSVRPGCFDEAVHGTAAWVDLMQALSVVSSPSGRYRVAKTTGPRLEGDGKGLLFEDLAEGRTEFWEGVEPITWMADTDKLIVSDRSGRFFLADGLGTGLASTAMVQPGSHANFIHGSDGFLFFSDGRRNVWVVDTTGQTEHVELTYPVGEVGVSCHVGGRCTPYIEYEQPVARQQTPSRYLLALTSGGRTTFHIEGRHLDFFGVAPDGMSALALARRGDGRLAYRVTRDGSIEQLPGQETGRDYQFAIMSADGGVAELRPYPAATQPLALLRDGQVRRLWRITPSGIRIYDQFEAGLPARLIVSGEDGKSIHETESGCAKNKVHNGRPIINETGDSTASHGYLYLPNDVSPKGIVAYFRGGVMEPFTGNADAITDHFVSSGFAVLEVDRRGLFGYGKDFLAPERGARLLQSAEDAWHLLDQTAANGMTPRNLPRFVVGISGGTRAAVAAISKGGRPWSGAMLIGTACETDGKPDIDVPTRVRTPSDFYDFINLSNDPDFEVCSAVIRQDSRIFALHGEDDAVTPPDGIKRLKGKNKGPHFVVKWVEDTGHAIPVPTLRESIDDAIRFWTADPSTATP